MHYYNNRDTVHHWNHWIDGQINVLVTQMVNSQNTEADYSYYDMER